MAIFNYSGLSESGGIYVIFNNHTWRIYVGSCKRFYTRWKHGHVASLLRNKHSNKFLQADFNKCREELGHDDFLEFHVIENMLDSSKEQRLFAEERWIKVHFDNGKHCYNLCDRAISREGNRPKNPEETKKRQSGRIPWNKGKKMLPGWSWNKGRTGIFSAEAIEKIKQARAKQVFSEESRKKGADSRKGHLVNEETRRKIGEKNRKKMIEKWKDPKYREMVASQNRTCVHNQETKKKISNSLKGRKRSPETIERMRIARLRLWKDPEFRKRVLAAQAQKRNKAKLVGEGI